MKEVKTKNNDQGESRTLEEIVAQLLTLDEAVPYAAQLAQDQGLEHGPSADTLKYAAQVGRLKAFKKGEAYLTNREEVREYMRLYEPKSSRSSNKAARIDAKTEPPTQADNPLVKG